MWYCTAAHEIGCPLPVPTGIPALPVIGYEHGYAQGERAGPLQIRYEYGYGYGYEYEHGWRFSVAQQSVVVSSVKNYHKSFANFDNECN